MVLRRVLLFAILALLSAHAAAVSLVWERHFNFSSYSSEEPLFATADRGDHVWIVSSFRDRPSGEVKLRISRVNPVGTILWSRLISPVYDLRDFAISNLVFDNQNNGYIDVIEDGWVRKLHKLSSTNGSTLASVSSGRDYNVSLQSDSAGGIYRRIGYGVSRYNTSLVRVYHKATNGSIGAAASDGRYVAFSTSHPNPSLGLDVLGATLWSRSDVPRPVSAVVESAPGVLHYVAYDTATRDKLVRLDVATGQATVLQQIRGYRSLVRLSPNALLIGGTGALVHLIAENRTLNLSLPVGRSVTWAARVNDLEVLLRTKDSSGPDETYRLFRWGPKQERWNKPATGIAPAGAHVTPAVGGTSRIFFAYDEASVPSGREAYLRRFLSTDGSIDWTKRIAGAITQEDESLFGASRFANGDLCFAVGNSANDASVGRLTTDGSTVWLKQNLSTGTEGVLAPVADRMMLGTWYQLKRIAPDGTVEASNALNSEYAVAANGDVYGFEDDCSRIDPFTMSVIWSREVSSSYSGRLHTTDTGVWIHDVYWGDIQFVSRSGVVYDDHFFFDLRNSLGAGDDLLFQEEEYEWVGNDYAYVNYWRRARLDGGATTIDYGPVADKTFAPLAAKKTTTGGYALVGYKGDDPAVLCLNADLTTKWFKLLPLANTVGKFVSMALDPGGDVYATGYRTIAGLDRVITARLNGNTGAPIWSVGSASGPSMTATNRRGTQLIHDQATNAIYVFGTHTQPSRLDKDGLVMRYAQ